MMPSAEQKPITTPSHSTPTGDWYVTHLQPAEAPHAPTNIPATSQHWPAYSWHRPAEQQEA